MFDDLLSYVIAAALCYMFSIKKHPSLLQLNMSRQFHEFCNHTSLHGWRYLADPKMSKPKNMFWFLILCTSITGATILIYYNTLTFKNATVITAVETMTAPLSEIFFPSITVCNINQARKSFFDDIGIRNNETLIRQIHSEYLGASNKKAKVGALPDELIKQLQKIEKTQNSLNWAVHQQCSDMFLQSTWNGYTYDNTTEIDYDFGTDYGICCWFTPQLNYTEIVSRYKSTHPNGSNHSRMGQMDINGYWFKNIEKGAASGKHNGYNLVFDVESFDYMYYMEGSEGVKVTILHHLDMPLTRQNSFNLSPGTENQIAVTPSIITTEGNAISRLTPAERDCYTEDEISLKYLPLKDGYRYGMDNCLFISAFERILEECNCYPGYNHNLIPGKSLEYELDIGPCSGLNLTCMNDILLRIGKYRYVNANGKKMKCRSRCEDQTNKLFVTTSTYPSKNTFRYRDEFCIILRRILIKCSGIKNISLEERYPGICEELNPLRNKDPRLYCNENQWNPDEIYGTRFCRNASDNKNCSNLENYVLQYAKDNLVIIHLSIKDPYAQKFQKEEKMPIINYIANLGGLLGFGLGFSVITGIEIVYHFLSAIIFSLFKCPSNSSSNAGNIEDICHSRYHHRRRGGGKNLNINQSCWNTAADMSGENETQRAISVEIDYCKTLNITI